MATRLTPKKLGREKPAAKKAAPGKTVSTNGPAGATRTEPATRAKKTGRHRKGSAVNAETAEVLRDAEAGKNLLHYPSLEAMVEDLGI